MRSSVFTMALGTALCVGLMSSSALLAQNDTEGGSPEQSSHSMHHGPMSPDQELAHLTKALNLSSEQQTQIKPVLENRRDQLMQMHQDTSISREQRMAKMKALDDQSNSKLEAVLTAEQKPKYEQMVAHRKEQMRARHGQNEPGQGEQPQ